MAEEEHLRVEAYSGSRYGQRPTAFTLDGQRHRVASVLREWLTPAGYCYRIITDDELRFDLLYDPGADRWTIRALDYPRAGLRFDR